MANKPLETSLLDRAIHFAVDAHAGTERRGKGFPYIVHPLEAVEIVATITPDQELLAAAALHDTVEDTDVTVEQIRAAFGDRVATLVDAESDRFEAGVSEEESWRSRKQAAIERLTRASLDAKVVAIGDKLSNMRAIARDYQMLGDALWGRFHAPGGKADHEWHYRGLLGALWELRETFAYKEFAQLIDDTFGEQPLDEWVPAPISMDDYEQSGEGYTAVSYNHRDGKTMVKLYADYMPRVAAPRELNNAAILVKSGLRTPLPGRFVTDGKRFGAEFQRIAPKKSFARAISDDPSQLEHYAATFAAMCCQLHATPCDKRFFPSQRDIAYGYVDKSRDLTDDEKARIRAFIASVPDADTCLHGDMHTGNVITNGTENWWIDISDFAWGNPMFDFGMYYFVTKCPPEAMTKDIFHLTRQQMEDVLCIVLRDYFGAATAAERQEVEARIAPFAALKIIDLANKEKMEPWMRPWIDNTLLKKDEKEI